jgi:hypothetical protein
MGLFKSVRTYVILAIMVAAISVVAFYFYAESKKSAVLSDDEILSAFTGEYFMNLLLGGSWLSLGPDKSFTKTVYLDVGPSYFDEDGEFTIEQGRIRLTSKGLKEVGYLIPIRWGQRKYLVEIERIASFCELAENGPQFGEWQIFLIQKGQENLPVEDFPILPDGELVCP